MAYTLINTGGPRDYHGTVLQFLEEIESDNVSAVVLVAITDAGPFISWEGTPMDLAAAASLVQSQATINYQEGMLDPEEDEDDDW